MFIPDLIEDDRAIYLDVNAIVMGSLEELYDMEEYAIAGVRDTNLMLVETGLASASIQGLYKPLKEREYEKINAGLNAISQFYLSDGCIKYKWFFDSVFI